MLQVIGWLVVLPNSAANAALSASSTVVPRLVMSMRSDQLFNGVTTSAARQ